MNILPKKRWHVRNRDNIARVRRDEANAAEEKKAIQERAKLAEREARRELLLQRSRSAIKSDYISLDVKEESLEIPQGHVNFFQELEDGTAEDKQINKEHERDKKQEKEKYEKQIGYLTYLGQDTNEALGKKSWYNVAPQRLDIKEEVNLKNKIREDPLTVMNKYTAISKKIDEFNKQSSKLIEYKSIFQELKKSKSPKFKTNSSDKYKKHKVLPNEKKSRDIKKRKRHYSGSSVNSEEEKNEKQTKLENLRLERLKREKEERRRTEDLLSKLRGSQHKEPEKTESRFKLKYNSQFNPYIAKQNYAKY